MIPKIKICGMKHNTLEVSELNPDYVGFIFYGKSARAFIGDIPVLPSNIKKVGVFVDESIATILSLIKKHSLDVVQLHGDESASYCKALVDELGELNIELWKVFSVGTSFDFSQLIPFESIVDSYLFDTKGKNKGGNGLRFDWDLLKRYPSEKPFIISGGIGIEDISDLKKLLASRLPIYGVDLNSKFELEPGLKDITALKTFQDELSR